MKEPAHILIVDDDDRIRDLTKRFLTLKGFRVSAAQDAATARSLMDNLAFDLAILDIMMPGEDGLSLLSGIRKGPAPANLEVPDYAFTSDTVIVIGQESA